MAMRLCEFDAKGYAVEWQMPDAAWTDHGDDLKTGDVRYWKAAGSEIKGDGWEMFALAKVVMPQEVD